MCSRYSLTSPPEAVRAFFGYRNEEAFPPRYNIAPTQPVAVVRNGHRGGRELALVRWGLIPSWAKDPTKRSTLINARAETAAQKPSFRASLRHRRCLVPADAFYEWTGKPGAKQPHMIRPSSGQLMGLAGIWEHWLGADGSEVESVAILTTEANREVAALHDRMPVIVSPEDFDLWLDCQPGSSLPVMDLLKPLADGSLAITAVSRQLNNPRNDGPEVQEPVESSLF